jgi:hypothetical protein
MQAIAAEGRRLPARLVGEDGADAGFGASQ